MGRHDSHLPKRTYGKAKNPADTPGLSAADKKRIERGVGLRTKDDAKKARRGDELERGER